MSKALSKGNLTQFNHISREELRDDGWFTPNTYANNFAEITDIPAVYLFCMADDRALDMPFIGYVGMSKHLINRIRSHNILPELKRTKYWVSTWFKAVDEQELRTVERFYIQKFNPPWNIVGKKRGVVLS